MNVQCPVGLQTIQLSWLLGTRLLQSPMLDSDLKGRKHDETWLLDERSRASQDRHPYVFPRCGHIFGNMDLGGQTCPLCRCTGPFVKLQMRWIPGIDSGDLSCIFNPCGHACSVECAEKWSKKGPLVPNNAPPDAVFRPSCPFCGVALSTNPPYSKLVF
eukprot:173005_1